MGVDNGTVQEGAIIGMVLLWEITSGTETQLCCMVNTACTCQHKICGKSQFKIPCLSGLIPELFTESVDMNPTHQSNPADKMRE